MRAGQKPILLFAVLVALAGCWSIFWKIAASATSSALDEWFALERSAGRVWTCADRDVSGYPFRIEVRCAQPAFSGLVAGVRVDGSVGDILAAANVYQPNLIVADIAPPLRLRSNPDRGSLNVNWRSLRVSYRSSDGALLLGSAALEAPDVEAHPYELAEIRVSARLFELHVQPNPAVQNAFDVATKADGLAMPIIDKAVGDPNPLDLVLAATITRADVLTRPGNALPMERWRRAGGQIQIADFKMAKGPANLSATGQLAIDENHRPRGRLDLVAAGLTGILQTLGVPTAMLAIGSLLGGGDAKAGQEPLKPGALKLALTFANGRASLGPIALPFLVPPLY